MVEQNITTVPLLLQLRLEFDQFSYDVLKASELRHAKQSCGHLKAVALDSETGGSAEGVGRIRQRFETRTKRWCVYHSSSAETPFQLRLEFDQFSYDALKASELRHAKQSCGHLKAVALDSEAGSSAEGVGRIRQRFETCTKRWCVYHSSSAETPFQLRLEKEGEEEEELEMACRQREQVTSLPQDANPSGIEVTDDKSDHAT